MFYDGSKLLSLKDINKQQPEIFISTSNRSAGKTTYFGKKLVTDFLKQGKKFILLYRYAYEITGVADKFFSDIRGLFFPNFIMTAEAREKDTFTELFIEEIGKEDSKRPCGYAIALNKADNIKKCSHLLSDASIILFDEFQTESGLYASNEVQKLQSIHTSLARGSGKQVKYLPIIMISNFVSLLNPYYTALHISERLQADTNYLRGVGWVLEQGFNDSASQAQKESAFNRAFGDTSYNKFSAEKFYLNDNKSFVKKMTGRNSYIMTLKYDNEFFGLRLYPDSNILYLSTSADMTSPKKYACRLEDMDEETTLVSTIPLYIQRLRDAFNGGQFRFQNLTCKSALFAVISY